MQVWMAAKHGWSLSPRQVFVYPWGPTLRLYAWAYNLALRPPATFPPQDIRCGDNPGGDHWSLETLEQYLVVVTATEARKVSKGVVYILLEFSFKILPFLAYCSDYYQISLTERDRQATLSYFFLTFGKIVRKVIICKFKMLITARKLWGLLDRCTRNASRGIIPVLLIPGLLQWLPWYARTYKMKTSFPNGFAHFINNNKTK